MARLLHDAIDFMGVPAHTIRSLPDHFAEKLLEIARDQRLAAKTESWQVATRGERTDVQTQFPRANQFTSDPLLSERLVNQILQIRPLSPHVVIEKVRATVFVARKIL